MPLWLWRTVAHYSASTTSSLASRSTINNMGISNNIGTTTTTCTAMARPAGNAEHLEKYAHVLVYNPKGPRTTLSLMMSPERYWT